MIRCPYPGCVLESHDDGDHRIGRPDLPVGVLRMVQEFRQDFAHGAMRSACDLEPEGCPHNHGAALGFYIDEFGFGWMLCYWCLQIHQVVITPRPGRFRRRRQNVGAAVRTKTTRPGECIHGDDPLECISCDMLARKVVMFPGRRA